jgi:DNA polymerase-3 subunit delta
MAMVPPPRGAQKDAREVSPQRVVQAAIQSRAFEPVYYLHGEDDFLKEGAVRDLVDAAIDPSTRDFNLEIRRGSELDAETLGSLLATPPMFAEKRAVVVRDVGSLKKAPRQQLDQYLERPASDTLLLLVNPAGAKADAALAKAGVSLDFESLTPERVRRWIAHQATTVHGMSVAEDALQLLQQAVGNDLHMLAAELDKCASYVRGAMEAARGEGDGGNVASATIDVDAISAVVGVRRGETTIDLLDAIAHRDAARAVGLVHHVLSQPKVTAVQVVIFLGTQSLALAFGRARKDSGIPTNRLPSEFFAFLKETGAYPGRPWGEAASLWTKVIDSWPASDCSRALQLLLEADIALKESTVSNPEQILTSLVLALCTPRKRTRKAA